MCWGRERKTEEKVDGQCKCGLEGEGTVGGGDASTGLCGGNLSETSMPTLNWEKYAEKEEAKDTLRRYHTAQLKLHKGRVLPQ